MAAKLVQTLISFLFLLASTARSQTTTFSYTFFGEKPTDLEKQGNARFPSDTTFLRLTEARKDQVGRAVHTTPIQFWLEGGQVDFQTTVNFIIKPSGGKLAADGLAFFISPIGTTIHDGSGGPNLGVFSDSGNSPGVFAVEFSTYVNGLSPDPEYPRIGINIGQASPIKTKYVGDAMVGQHVNAQISYSAETSRITVIVTAGGKKFELTHDYDLSKLLEQEVQVGLSAATGSVTYARHDIISWYFNSYMTSGAAINKCVM